MLAPLHKERWQQDALYADQDGVFYGVPYLMPANTNTRIVITLPKINETLNNGVDVIKAVRENTILNTNKNRTGN